MELVREYAHGHSEDAFAALVTRHIHLVYSVALRQVRESHLAEDVTQAVFVILAQKAKKLGDKTILSGWLCRTARYVSANAMTIQRRRERRDQEVSMQTMSDEPSADDHWMEIAPLLEGALARLNTKDHDAIVLRFFEGKDLRQVGVALGASEEAAKKRVGRALEKLRRFFLKRRIHSTTTAVAEMISANSIQTAPAGLDKAISAMVLAKGATISTSTLTLIKGALKIMAWTKAKTVATTSAVIIIATMSAVVAVDYFWHIPFLHSTRQTLPTGTVTPMVGKGSGYGVILASDGSLWSWGEEPNGWPALGLKGVQNSVSLRRIGNDTDWRDVAVGSDACLAVKSDGSLWAWGGNYGHQLGDGTKITRPTPVRSVPGNDWAQAASSGPSSYAIKDDGTLWAWGDGYLGTGDTKQRTHAVEIGDSDNWTKIRAGYVQTVGLQSDGSLWFWGSLTGDITNVILAPTQVSPDTNWTDACFGYFTIFAIKSDGTLWSWGREANYYTGQDPGLNSKPMQVGTENDWQSCSSQPGGFYLLLRKKDGSLWALDASEHRRIKPPSEYKPIKLEAINFHGDIAAFAAGGDNIGVILTRDGEVWTWGNVLGEHRPSDFFGPGPRDYKTPTYTVRPQPWRLSISE